jgi:beta-glucosidase/6-phospho-beta-glucosidase/beta-galactosidase
MKIDWDIESFLKEKRFDNFMTRRIAGNYDLNKAKRYLDEKFSFVGLIESFDESLVLMRNELFDYDINLNYQKKNVSRDKNYGIDSKIATKKILEKVKRRNELDIELYEFASKIIFNRYRKSYEGNLDTAIRDLQSQNSKYKFSKIRHFLCILYRWLLYRNIEYVLHKKCH